MSEKVGRRRPTAASRGAAEAAAVDEALGEVARLFEEARSLPGRQLDAVDAARAAGATFDELATAMGGGIKKAAAWAWYRSKTQKRERETADA